MSNATQSKNCPKCGEPIPPEAPQGLCPKCLLREVSIPTETGKGLARPAELPTQEALAAAFPHLEILELIGQGGMGLVYKARQPKLDRLVALKILPQSLAADPTFTERFTREGRVLAKLNHPNIVTVHDFGRANGFFYLLMEFVNGVNLRQAMQAGRFTPAQALALVPDICEALQYAHTQGILHRDIKPENILLDANGRIKIADFGIAKLIGEAKPEGALTATSAAIGTPHYMAPEQIERPAEVDHRADIYSLGVVLYEMLTGELPLGRFPPPSQKTPVNANVDAVVLRALEKERERRYQSAGEVKTEVEGLSTAGGHPPNTTHPGGLAMPVWKLVILIIAAVCGSLAISALILGFIRGPRSRTVSPATAVHTKIIELSGATNRPPHVGTSKPIYFGIGTSTGLLPEQKFRPRLQFSDGSFEEGGSYEATWRRAGQKESSLQFSWLLPDSIETDQLAAAAAKLEKWNGKRLTLQAGHPVTLFTVKNASGQELSAYLEYLVWTPPTNSPLVASVRVINTKVSRSFMPTPGYHGVVEAGLDAAIPDAHVLDCIGLTLAGLEELTRVSCSKSQRHTLLGCEWHFPTTFTTNDHQEAARQLTGATFLIHPKERVQAFAVTNNVGDVMRGYLELLPPSTTK